MKKLVTLATTFALSFGLMGSMVRADSDGDQDRSNTRRVARHQRVERERLERHHRKERRRAKESDINRRRVEATSGTSGSGAKAPEPVVPPHSPQVGGPPVATHPLLPIH